MCIPLSFTTNSQCLTIWLCENSKVAGGAQIEEWSIFFSICSHWYILFLWVHTDGRGYIVPTAVAVVEDVSFNLLNIYLHTYAQTKKKYTSNIEYKNICNIIFNLKQIKWHRVIHILKYYSYTYLKGYTLCTVMSGSIALNSFQFF